MRATSASASRGEQRESATSCGLLGVPPRARGIGGEPVTISFARTPGARSTSTLDPASAPRHILAPRQEGSPHAVDGHVPSAATSRSCSCSPPAGRLRLVQQRATRTVEARASRSPSTSTAAFPAGTAVRDAYTGTTADRGRNRHGHPHARDAAGVVLLERAGAAPTPFNWQNATVYFALTDRFTNGDPPTTAATAARGTAPARSAPGTAATGRGSPPSSPTSPTSASPRSGSPPSSSRSHGWVAGGIGRLQALRLRRLLGARLHPPRQELGSAADLQALVDEAHPAASGCWSTW